MAISRETFIKEGSKLAREKVYLPEIDSDPNEGYVFIREMTALERDRLDASMFGNGNTGNNWDDMRARIIANVTEDDHGNKIFNSGDIKSLSDMGSSVIDRMFGVAQRLSGITSQDVEEMRKNSNDQGGNSTSN